MSNLIKRDDISLLYSFSKGGNYISSSSSSVFSQGEEGTSWYIILKGSVNVVIYGKVGICFLPVVGTGQRLTG